MIWIIGGIIIGFIVGIIVSINEEWGFIGGVFNTFLSILIGVFVGVMLLLCSSIICAPLVETEHVKVKTTEIVALKDNNELSGSFFLGSGCVDENTRYYYMENTERGKRMRDISAENAYLNESNSETPRIETYQSEWKNKAWNLIAFPSEGGYYKIYIPENSIITDFEVDME
jgi:hypothetical protein